MYIKTKDGDLLPFKMNAPQLKLYNILKEEFEKGKPLRIIILKARQLGFSTLVEALIFVRTAFYFNTESAIVAHDEETATHIFKMSRLFYNKLPEPLKAQILSSNAKEIIFNNKADTGLRSGIRCLTAGNSDVGRGRTIQNLHISEYSSWRGDKKNILGGLLSAVPSLPDTLVVIESTAKGYDHFKELWDNAVEGKNDFFPVFFPWFECADYRLNVLLPDEDLTEEERKLLAQYNLDKEQLAWRRWSIANLCNGDKVLFAQEYPACPEEAFRSSGDCLFDKDAITAQIEKIRKNQLTQQVRGEFEYTREIQPVRNAQGQVVGVEKTIKNIKFVQKENGYIFLHEPPQPRKNSNGEVISLEPYTIGGDTAGLGQDFYAAKVVSNIDGRTVATRHIQRIDEDKYAETLYCLGKHYHDALIGIETNYSRTPMRELADLKYPNLYLRERLDTLTREVQKVYGFETTAQTKPLIINALIAGIRDNPRIECDLDTLHEMLTFVRKDNGKLEALNGYHDDLVIAKAIANFIATQQGTPNWIQAEVRQKETSILEDIFYNFEKEKNGKWITW